MGVFIFYILPIIIVVGEIIFMRKCLIPGIPRIVCLITFAASLVPLLGAIVCISSPVILGRVLEGGDVELADNRFNNYWFR